MTTRTVTLSVASTVATAAFGALAVSVARRKTSRLDRALRPRLKARKGHPVRQAADPLAGLGKWWTYVPLATAAGVHLIETSSARPRAHRSAIAGAEAIMLSALGAAVLSQVFDRVLPQPPTPPGQKRKRKPVFPSGHAFGPGAVAWTAVYVYQREGRVHPGLALVPAFGYPAAMVAGKMIEEKHWASDALGGILAGLAWAAACAALYESRRE